MSAILNLIAISKRFLKTAKQDGWPTGDLTKAIQDAETEYTDMQLQLTHYEIGAEMNIEHDEAMTAQLAAAQRERDDALAVVDAARAVARQWARCEPDDILDGLAFIDKMDALTAAIAALPAPHTGLGTERSE